MTTKTIARTSLRLSLGAPLLALTAAFAACNDGPVEQGPETETAGLAATQADAPPPMDGDQRPLSDGEERVGGELVATLETGADSKLVFVGLGEGREETVAVVSATAPGEVDVSELPELAGASPLEIFNAASRPGTQLPDTIVRIYGREATLGPQGWGLERAARAGGGASLIQTGNCNNTTFMNAVNSYEYNDRGTPLDHLDQVPGVDSDNVWTFYHDCFGTSWEGGECPSYYRYDTSSLIDYSNVDGFYGRVAVCGLDFHPTLSGNWGSWTHPGPTIQFWSRSPSATSYNLSYQVDVPASKLGHVWKFQGVNNNYDRKTIVKETEAADGFDIATAVEDL